MTHFTVVSTMSIPATRRSRRQWVIIAVIAMAAVATSSFAVEVEVVSIDPIEVPINANGDSLYQFSMDNSQVVLENLFQPHPPNANGGSKFPFGKTVQKPDQYDIGNHRGLDA